MMREFSPFLISIGTLLMADFQQPEKFEAVGEGTTMIRSYHSSGLGNLEISEQLQLLMEQVRVSGLCCRQSR
jgi:hypothetical protein